MQFLALIPTRKLSPAVGFCIPPSHITDAGLGPASCLVCSEAADQTLCFSSQVQQVVGISWTSFQAKSNARVRA